MNLHPLINQDSAHYDAKGKSAIELLEEQLTVIEMIGFCKGNIFKYKYRAEHKGQKDSDIKKIQTYENYLNFLVTLAGIHSKELTVKSIYILENISFRYR